MTSNIRSSDAIHCGQLSDGIRGDEDARNSLYSRVAIRSVCSIELIATADPLQTGDLVDLIEECDWTSVS
jgi:hypothetical protein